jgi:hypothetical protein
MALHRYAFLNAKDEILEVTEPLEHAPPPMIVHGQTMICQQIASDSPGVHAVHHAHMFELHSPRIVLRNDRRVYEEWQIRRKSDA